MNVAVRAQTMTQTEFFAWAQSQDGPYEYDGQQPVAMTGGTIDHSVITGNILTALNNRLGRGSCRPLGPDAGINTVGEVIRYPDALVTCSPFRGTDYVVPNPVIVFEVISRTSGGTDRIVKLREYQLVASILRYVIVETANVGLTVLERASGDFGWTARAAGPGDTLQMPEIGIELPVDELYAGTDVGNEPG